MCARSCMCMFVRVLSVAYVRQIPYGDWIFKVCVRACMGIGLCESYSVRGSDS